MTYNLYSIRDKKGVFWSPKVEVNEASAIRNFSHLVNTGDSILNFAPNDFDLYCVGQFNDETGNVTHFDSTHFVVDASSLIGGD